MTIKELEERTGMPRANIRFYESERLIAPKRLDNGYRDYSEEDAETLEKIKLLRELHLDIDTIRMVQKGELTLEQALFTLLTRLEGDKAAIDRAVEVCRRLEQSRVEYGALEPKPWLEQLEQPKLAQPAQYAPPKDEEPVDYAYRHPWKRWLARSVDAGLYDLVISAVLILAFRWDYYRDGAFAQWFVGLLGLGFMLICEPFWLHFWGWTPGKWIFGLKVRSRWGEKLSIRQGFLRAGGVFVSGYGCNIPFVSAWCTWKFWRRYKEEDDSPWDWNGNLYVHEGRRLSWLMWLGAAALTGFLAVTIMLQACLPPNRGGLTAAEFYENYNFYLDYLKINSGKRLNEDGQWTNAYDATVVYIDFGTVEYSDLELLVENGGVAAVTLSDTAGRNAADFSAIYMDQTYYQIAVLALAGAQEEFNCFTYNLSGWMSLWNDLYQSEEIDYRGIHISQTVECSGYEGAGRVRMAIEGEEQSYVRTVTISLTGSGK